MNRPRIHFGHLIRANRLRFYLLPSPQEGLLRMHAVKDGFCCEFYPLGLVPCNTFTGSEYVLWAGDRGEKARETVDASPYLRSIKRVKQPFTVILGEQGERVREMAP